MKEMKNVGAVVFGVLPNGLLAGTYVYRVTLDGEFLVQEALVAVVKDVEKEGVKNPTVYFPGGFSAENEGAVFTLMTIFRDRGYGVVCDLEGDLLYKWSQLPTWTRIVTEGEQPVSLPAHEVIFAPKKKKLKEPEILSKVNVLFVDAQEHIPPKALREFVTRSAKPWRLLPSVVSAEEPVRVL